MSADGWMTTAIHARRRALGLSPSAGNGAGHTGPLPETPALRFLKRTLRLKCGHAPDGAASPDSCACASPVGADSAAAPGVQSPAS